MKTAGGGRFRNEDPVAQLNLTHREIERCMGILFTIARSRRGLPLDDRRRRQLVDAQRFFSDDAPLYWAHWRNVLLPALSSTAPAPAVLHNAESVTSAHVRLKEMHPEAGSVIEEWISKGSLPAAASARLNSVLAELQSIYSTLLPIEETLAGALHPTAACGGGAGNA